MKLLLTRGGKGARRVDDRCVISGIVRMLKSGARWRDSPEIYGPYTTVYNASTAGVGRGSRQIIVYALTGSMSLDSSHVNVHRSAARAKRGAFSNAVDRPRRSDYQNSRDNRRYRLFADRPD